MVCDFQHNFFQYSQVIKIAHFLFSSVSTLSVNEKYLSNQILRVSWPEENTISNIIILSTSTVILRDQN